MKIVIQDGNQKKQISFRSNKNRKKKINDSTSKARNNIIWGNKINKKKTMSLCVYMCVREREKEKGKESEKCDFKSERESK